MAASPHYPTDWLEIARKDWTRVRIMYAEADYEAAAFFLQQSVEKYLKAFLLGHGWSLKKIHELPALLADAASIAPGLVSYRSICARLSGYYLAERYPPVAGSGLTAEDIRDNAKSARMLILDLFPAEILFEPDPGPAASGP